MKRNAMFTVVALAVTLQLVALGSTAFAGGIHGRVLGMNEEGKFSRMVSSAKIDFINRAGQTVASTTAGPSGYYRVSLPPGEYTYKAKANGYKDQDAGRGLRLTLTDEYALYNISLLEGTTSPDRAAPDVPTVDVGVLRGRVVEAATDGKVGVARAAITLRKQGTRELLRIVSPGEDEQADRAGRYEVVLEVGSYLASASAAGFERLVDPAPIEIVANEDATRDFVLDRHEPAPDLLAKQGIRGTVAVLQNGTAVPPTFPVRVDVLTLLDQEVLYTTGPDDTGGVFSQATTPGAYRVVAYAPDNGYHKAVSPPVFVFAGRFSNVKLILRPEEPDVLPPTEFAIEVHVVDRQNEEPLEGALVRLRRKGEPIRDALRGTADASGVATFRTDKAGSYLTLAEASGYRPAGAEFEAGPKQSNRVQLALLPSSTPPQDFKVVVSVRESENNRPIPSATVVLVHEGQSPRDGIRETTAASGEASFRVETPGNYAVIAGASGYVLQQQKLVVGTNEPNRADIMLRSRGEPPTEHVAVTGRIVYEPPRGTTGFALISGAALEWRRMAPLPGLPRSVTSNQVGQYRIDLREGTYQVKVKPPSEEFLPATVTVKVSRGMKPWDFSLKRKQEDTPDALVQVEGFVLSRERDQRLRAVPDSKIEWRRTDGGPPVLQTTRSTRMGRYTVRLPAGGYDVTITPPETHERLAEKVRVSIGMSRKNFTLTPTNGVVPPPPMRLVGVTGRVIGIKPPSRVRFPVANAEVLWIRSGKTAKATTDSTGTFKLQLAAGMYRVVAKAKGYEEFDRPMSVRPDMATAMISLQATRTEPVEPSRVAVDLRAVEQRLLPSRRRVAIPLSNARVSIMQRTKMIASGMTQRDGNYRALLAPGSYQVRVTREGYGAAAISLVVSSSAIKRDIVLRREQPQPPPTVKRALTVRVVSSITMRPGTRPILRPVPQATVSITQGNSRVATGRTDNSGNYRVTLAPGSYTIFVVGRGVQPATAKATVGTSDTTQQVIVKPVVAFRRPGDR